MDVRKKTWRDISTSNCSNKKSGKDKASYIPSWAAGQKPRPGKSGKDFAQRLMDEEKQTGVIQAPEVNIISLKRMGIEINKFKYLFLY